MPFSSVKVISPGRSSLSLNFHWAEFASKWKSMKYQKDLSAARAPPPARRSPCHVSAACWVSCSMSSPCEFTVLAVCRLSASSTNMSDRMCSTVRVMAPFMNAPYCSCFIMSIMGSTKAI